MYVFLFKLLDVRLNFLESLDGLRRQLNEKTALSPCRASGPCAIGPRARVGQEREPLAADAIAAFVARVVLTFISTCLVTKFQRRYPMDGPLLSTTDDGQQVRGAVPFAVPGAKEVIVKCNGKKAMNTDILLSTKSAESAMSEEIPDPTRKSLSTKTPGAESTLVFKPGFAKIATGRVWAGFDRATSRGECKEEFVIEIDPQFIFRTIDRESIDMFLGKEYFMKTMDELLPYVNNKLEPIRGVTLAVVQGCSWCYSVLAKELEKSHSPETALKNLHPDFVPVHHFLRRLAEHERGYPEGGDERDHLVFQLLCRHVRCVIRENAKCCPLPPKLGWPHVGSPEARCQHHPPAGVRARARGGVRGPGGADADGRRVDAHLLGKGPETSRRGVEEGDFRDIVVFPLCCVLDLFRPFSVNFCPSTAISSPFSSTSGPLSKI